ncbi:hypothetical protein [Alteromonas sp.]|uniref:hypothetical protein n=1 Tax=Alteromonas sp. TaxID=232 RepID=UPI003F4B1E3F
MTPAWRLTTATFAAQPDASPCSAIGAMVCPAPSKLKVRQLAQQNQKLKRDLHRKDKALAETAALLVLQKKVQDIWKEDEDI